MKSIVFGATGTLGRHLVQQLLDAGHEVTAFSRNPSKIAAHVRGLSLAKGDVLDLAAVSQAVAGHEIVFCALGDGNKGSTRSPGTANIIQAMKTHRIRRLIVQTTLGMGESAGNLNFFWRTVMFGFLLKKAFADHKTQEEYVTSSGLDFTIVRPSAFTDKATSHPYRVGFDGSVKDLTLKISRADVAAFMIAQIKDDRWKRRAVSISS